MAQRPRVVIVGGGFGGLYAAKNCRGVPVDVTLIAKENYHLFYRSSTKWRLPVSRQAILPCRYVRSSARSRISERSWGK